MSLATASLVLAAAAATTVSLINRNRNRNNNQTTYLVGSISQKAGVCIVVLSNSIPKDKSEFESIQYFNSSNIMYSDFNRLRNTLQSANFTNKRVFIYATKCSSKLYNHLFRTLQGLPTLRGLIFGDVDSEKVIRNGFKNVGNRVNVNEIFSPEKMKNIKNIFKANNVVLLDTSEKSILSKIFNFEFRYSPLLIPDPPPYIPDENSIETFKEIVSETINAINYLPFNDLTSQNLHCYWNRGKILIQMPSGEFRRVLEKKIIEEGEEEVYFEEVYFNERPKSISSVINNRYYFDNESLKFTDLNGVRTNFVFNLEDGWIEIVEPVYELLDLRGCLLNVPTMDLQYYKSRFRNVVAQRSASGVHYFLLVNDARTPINNLQYLPEEFNSNTYISSYPLIGDDDWVLLESSYPSVSVPASEKKSIVGDTNSIIMTEFLSMYLNLCDNLEKLRNFINRQQNVFVVNNTPANEKIFFHELSKSNSDATKVFGNNQTTTIAELYRHYGKNGFNIFYDFIVDVFVVRYGGNKINFFNHPSETLINYNNSYDLNDRPQSGCEWKIMYVSRLTKNGSFALRPINHAEFFAMTRDYRNGRSSANPWETIQVKKDDDYFYIADKFGYKTRYHPKFPASRACPYYESIGTGQVNYSSEGPISTEWEKRPLRDGWISFFDGRDLYKKTFSDLSIVHNIFGLGKWKGTCINNKTYNMFQVKSQFIEEARYNRLPSERLKTSFSWGENKTNWVFKPSHYEINESKNELILMILDEQNKIIPTNVNIKLENIPTFQGLKAGSEILEKKGQPLSFREQWLARYHYCKYIYDYSLSETVLVLGSHLLSLNDDNFRDDGSYASLYKNPNPLHFV